MGETPTCAFDSDGPPMKFAKAHFGCGVVTLSEQKSVLVAGWYDPLGLSNAEINPRAEQLILDFSKATSDWKWRVSGPGKKELFG